MMPSIVILLYFLHFQSQKNIEIHKYIEPYLKYYNPKFSLPFQSLHILPLDSLN